MLMIMMTLALAALSPRTLDAPRKAFAACLKDYETRSLAANTDAVAFAAGLGAICTAEGDTLARALVAYDIAMGGKRASAAANAASDVADYRLTSDERYRDLVPPAKP